MIATHEFVVPKSIPITSPTSPDLYRRCDKNEFWFHDAAAAAVLFKKGDFLVAADTAKDPPLLPAAERKRRLDVADNIIICGSLFVVVFEL
jgi:hypothetical protein